ncbi:putative Aquaporin-2 [Glarea lozoyensis 74030]|uniref:Putative Aquaporin-2 n=1 Tax=Glarea lozoyensis (strain ATCC 74030 / MF5533) TaxID=1104152 RepID=H0EQT3_GLAL7|nr:putative Aquaporin-2 [Glarea lozoyensis 74030]
MSRSRADEYRSHPDLREKSRPPRTYRNVDAWDRGPGSASKPYFEESREFRGSMDPDLEKGGYSPYKRPSEDQESIDGYNYDQHKKGYKPSNAATIDFKNLSPEERKEVMRLPWTQWMHSDFKNHFVATMGEFVGTTMFLFFAFAGTQVANIQSTATSTTTSGGATGFNIAVYLYISVIFGFSLMVNVWIFFRISGGLFNPAVTFGMVLVGAVPVVRAVCLFFAQIVGAIAASAMVLGLFPTPLNVRTTLAGGASLVQGVGPFLGTLIAVFFYKFIKMLEYEMANPGQDGDPENDPTQNEEKRQELMKRRQMRSESKVRAARD